MILMPDFFLTSSIISSKIFPSLPASLNPRGSYEDPTHARSGTFHNQVRDLWRRTRNNGKVDGGRHVEDCGITLQVQYVFFVGVDGEYLSLPRAHEVFEDNPAFRTLFVTRADKCDGVRI